MASFNIGRNVGRNVRNALNSGNRGSTNAHRNAEWGQAFRSAFNNPASFLTPVGQITNRAANNRNQATNIYGNPAWQVTGGPFSFNAVPASRNLSEQELFYQDPVGRILGRVKKYIPRGPGGVSSGESGGTPHKNDMSDRNRFRRVGNVVIDTKAKPNRKGEKRRPKIEKKNLRRRGKVDTKGIMKRRVKASERPSKRQPPKRGNTKQLLRRSNRTNRGASNRFNQASLRRTNKKYQKPRKPNRSIRKNTKWTRKRRR